MIGTVYWVDDPARTRVIRRLCRRCRASMGKWTSDDFKKKVDVDIVSPNGIGHAAAHVWQAEGSTACGIDATGPNWWWRE